LKTSIPRKKKEQADLPTEKNPVGSEEK